MKRKIYLRLVGIAALAIFLTMASMTYIQYDILRSRVKQDLSTSAKLLKDTRYFESETVDVKTIDLSTDIEELRVTWIASDGNVLYDNDTDALKLENHRDRPEILSAFETGKGESVRRSDTMNKNTFYYAVLLDNGTVLRVASKAESIISVFFSVLPVIAFIVLIITGVCVLLSRMLTRQLVSPIEELADNLEAERPEVPYSELDPFVNIIKKQHSAILSSARARQDFTASVSHELKTPLTAILGYTELLENGMADEKQKQRFYKEIGKNSNRLLSLINDIILLSELDRPINDPHFESLDLYDIAKETTESLRINAVKNGISLEFNGDHSTINGNPDMIKELVENLVENAIRYNRPNGKVNVRVENEPSVKLIVEDTGIGIPSDEQGRIFERFYRVDKSRSKAKGGTGLGLAIVKHIVETHEAKIRLSSEVDKGTRIEIEFPQK